jgi:hypothetical protein
MLAYLDEFMAKIKYFYRALSNAFQLSLSVHHWQTGRNSLVPKGTIAQEDIIGQQSRQTNSEVYRNDRHTVLWRFFTEYRLV